MNMAERIMSLRKKQGWSQEELAEHLGVSRQSVSKWESGASTPDINRILELSKLFNVSTDYLLKGNETEEEMPAVVMPAAGKLMTADDINEFMEAVSSYGKKISTGVALCILSPALLIGLTGFADESGSGTFSENTAVIIGLAALFILVACAVMLFIRGSSQMSRYRFVKEGRFYLEQGSIGVIEGVLAEFEQQFSSGIAKGVALCIMSPVPLIIIALLGFEDEWVVLMVPVLLFLVSIAVRIFIRLGVVKDGFLQLLKRTEPELDETSKENAKREEKIGSVFWPIIVAVYLLWSFLAGAWHTSWMIFPIAGLIFAAITNAMKK